MKLGTNLKHGQKICIEQESELHQNFNRTMPFEVFSLKIVDAVSFFKNHQRGRFVLHISKTV